MCLLFKGRLAECKWDWDGTLFDPNEEATLAQTQVRLTGSG